MVGDKIGSSDCGRRRKRDPFLGEFLVVHDGKVDDEGLGNYWIGSRGAVDRRGRVVGGPVLAYGLHLGGVEAAAAADALGGVVRRES